jgi:hypothetical protein
MLKEEYDVHPKVKHCSTKQFLCVCPFTGEIRVIVVKKGPWFSGQFTALTSTMMELY